MAHREHMAPYAPLFGTVCCLGNIRHRMLPSLAPNAHLLDLSGSSHILPYFPPLVLLRIQYCPIEQAILKSSNSILSFLVIDNNFYAWYEQNVNSWLIFFLSKIDYSTTQPCTRCCPFPDYSVQCKCPICRLIPLPLMEHQAYKSQRFQDFQHWHLPSYDVEGTESRPDRKLYFRGRRWSRSDETETPLTDG